MLENRTIRNALTNRVPEVYFVSKGEIIGNKVKYLMLAKIARPGHIAKPFYLVADMPNTALISHKELLNTMVSEIYDEVSKIKRGEKSPDLVPDERNLPPLTSEDLAAFDFKEIEELVTEKPGLLFT